MTKRQRFDPAENTTELPRIADMAPEILSAIWLAAGVTERDLFGGPEAGKESEFVIVNLRLAPVSMKGCDQHLGVLNAEGIDRRSILLADSGAFEREIGRASCRERVFNWV